MLIPSAGRLSFPVFFSILFISLSPIISSSLSLSTAYGGGGRGGVF